MLGDTAVMVHPDDERYTAVVGKQVRLPLCDRLILVVAVARRGSPTSRPQGSAPRRTQCQLQRVRRYGSGCRHACHQTSALAACSAPARRTVISSR